VEIENGENLRKFSMERIQICDINIFGKWWEAMIDDKEGNPKNSDICYVKWPNRKIKLE